MVSKKGEFGFVWFFAIVVGGLILFLAVYGAVKWGEGKDYQTNTEIAKNLAILTDPMEAGFAEGSFGKVTFNGLTRINAYCFEENLGKNEIAVSTKSKLGDDEWTSSGSRVSIYNKYIFSEELNEGEQFYIFSKPFEFPYEVSDLIFFTSENYCFLNAPEGITEEINGLNIPNIAIDNCSESDQTVCFGVGNDCDIRVYGSCSSDCSSVFDEGTVVKDGKEMKYIGSLIYGAIFSEKEIYDCNVNRLLERSGRIAEILAEKVDLMNARDCSNDLKSGLVIWGELAQNTSSEKIISLKSLSTELNRENGRKQCRLW